MIDYAFNIGYPLPGIVLSGVYQSSYIASRKSSGNYSHENGKCAYYHILRKHTNPLCTWKTMAIADETAKHLRQFY